MKRFFFTLSAALLLAASCQEKPANEDPTITLDPTEITATADGGATTVNVTANCDWKFTCNDAWVSIDPAEGKGSAKVTVTIAENEATKERKSTINVNSTAKKLTIKVTQQAKEEDPNVGPDVPPTPSKITEIKTAEDFASFVAAATSYELTDVVTLEADIVIAAPADSVMCVLDGKDHTITLADYASEGDLADYGVIRILYGTVKNLKVDGKITVAQGETSPCHVGGIAGTAKANASFENCTNNIAITVSNKATHHVGGIAGFIESGVSLANCTNKAAITADYSALDSSNASQLGGIVGHLEESGSLTDCINDGKISYVGAGTARIGGMVGYINNLTTATIKNCTNNGELYNYTPGYSAKKWVYAAGMTGYFGTPTIGAVMTNEGCINNGAITSDGAGTNLRHRVAGINGHAGNTDASADENGNGVHTWIVKDCTNNGPITVVNAKGNTYIGGIAPFGEPGGKYIFENCTSNAALSSDYDNANDTIGGILANGGSTDCEFKNIIVTEKTVITLPAKAIAGLIAGKNGAFKTDITGKVGAAKIVKGGEETVATAENYQTIIFGAALGATGTTTGVTFGL